MKTKNYKTVPVYLNDQSLCLYHKVKQNAEKSGKNFSECMRRGMECVALEQECKIEIAMSAYFALQDGRFDVLTCTHLSDGTALIGVTEEAYSPKDGSPGYADRMLKFLNKRKES